MQGIRVQSFLFSQIAFQSIIPTSFGKRVINHTFYHIFFHIKAIPNPNICCLEELDYLTGVWRRFKTRTVELIGLNLIYDVR